MTNRWTPKEDALIRRLRGKGSDTDTIAAALPHRTRDAVASRLQHLRDLGLVELLDTSWTPEEDALLCKLRGQGKRGADIRSHFPQRTGQAIARRIALLIRDGRIERQRSKNPSYKPWTSREEQTLIRMRGANATLDKIKLSLPQRTRGAIAQRIQELIDAGVIEPTLRAPHSRRPWSREEDLLVAEMRRARRTVDEMAAALDRSVPSVNNRIAQRVRKGELDLLR